MIRTSISFCLVEQSFISVFSMLDPTQVTLISSIPHFGFLTWTPKNQSCTVLCSSYEPHDKPHALQRDPPESVRCPGELSELTHGVDCPRSLGLRITWNRPWGIWGGSCFPEWDIQVLLPALGHLAPLCSWKEAFNRLTFHCLPANNRYSSHKLMTWWN